LLTTAPEPLSAAAVCRDLEKRGLAVWSLISIKRSLAKQKRWNVLGNRRRAPRGYSLPENLPSSATSAAPERRHRSRSRAPGEGGAFPLRGGLSSRTPFSVGSRRLFDGEDRIPSVSHCRVYLVCIQNIHRPLILVGCNMTMQECTSGGPEVGRKFLVPEQPAFWKDCDRKRIRQGYLAVGKNGTELRVRQEGKQYFLTIKSGKGQARVEEELRIGRTRFDSSWPLTRGRRVRKVRYFAPHHDRTLEVDVYRRKLKGLVIAEAEFADTESARAFEPPGWVGREVTDDERFCNQSLARNGMPGEPPDTAPPKDHHRRHPSRSGH
jgi:CYTH domain-containing protein